MRSARSTSASASVIAWRVPSVAILVRQQHHGAIGGEPRIGAREVQSHQRQQAHRLRLVGHEAHQQRGQPFGVARQVAPLGRVPGRLAR